MTPKHFSAIAEALKDSRLDQGPYELDGTAFYSQWLYTCKTVATALARLNPNFNRSRFLEACGVDEEE